MEVESKTEEKKLGSEQSVNEKQAETSIASPESKSASDLTSVASSVDAKTGSESSAPSNESKAPAENVKSEEKQSEVEVKTEIKDVKLDDEVKAELAKKQNEPPELPLQSSATGKPAVPVQQKPAAAKPKVIAVLPPLPTLEAAPASMDDILSGLKIGVGSAVSGLKDLFNAIASPVSATSPQFAPPSSSSSSSSSPSPISPAAAASSTSPIAAVAAAPPHKLTMKEREELFDKTLSAARINIKELQVCRSHYSKSNPIQCNSIKWGRRWQAKAFPIMQ